MGMSSAPPHILLADDDPNSRAVFSEFFERLGWRYDVLGESNQVMAALASSGYDVVIADVTMPGMDAMQFLDQVRLQSPAQAVIAVSDNASVENTLAFFRKGATDVMARPVDFSWLEHIVTDVVNVLRHDQSERKLYRYVTSERTEMSLSCRELAESNCFSLPIIERLQECGLLDEPCALRLKLAIQEAVMNGFEHGNLELLSAWKEEIQDDGRDKFSIVRRQRLDDPLYGERRVRVVSWFHEGVLEITVSDDGAGFLSRDGETIVGSACPNDLSCSGRGLALMSSAVDIVRYARRGAEVTLIKQLMKHEDS